MELLFSSIYLTLVEIILGIDNVLFVSLTASTLPKNLEKKATNIGLVVALLLRISLLSLISIILKLHEPIIVVKEIININLSIKDIIIFIGGGFLIIKSALEVYETKEKVVKQKNYTTLLSATIQIALINLVFSIDSILTAIGLTDNITVMIVSIILSTAVMLIGAKHVNEFINKYPTFKIVALVFLIIIGTMLILEAFGLKIEKWIVYFTIFVLAITETIIIKKKLR